MVCKNCELEFKELNACIEELEKKLARYENANTPSSKVRFPPKIQDTNKNRAGQKEGHKGITRQMCEPTMEIEVIADKCPRCKNKLGEPFKTTTRIIEEIPEPLPITIIEYRINHYKCECCGNKTIAKVPILDGSRFGNNTLSHVTMLKFEDRLPLRKVCTALKRQFNLNISSGTVFDITRRVSDKLKAEYNKIKTAIRMSESVNIDETGMRVDGLNFYLWVFTTKDATLYLIRKSRSKSVIEEVLGKDYRGVIGCDGWTSYSSYTDKIQRCWAHLLREAMYLSKQFESAKSLYNGLKKLYEMATGNKPPSKDNLILEMTQWTDYADSFRELRKFSTTVKNGIAHWFTFVDNNSIEPTNNRAERALRELIVQRKIIGTLRNVKGSTIMERINSCIVTWKQNNLNPFTLLKAQLG